MVPLLGRSNLVDRSRKNNSNEKYFLYNDKSSGGTRELYTYSIYGIPWGKPLTGESCLKKAY
jgi:hypothetical protein